MARAHQSTSTKVTRMSAGHQEPGIQKLVHLVLEYGSVIWDAYQQHLIQCLEHANRQAARFTLAIILRGMRKVCPSCYTNSARNHWNTKGPGTEWSCSTKFTITLQKFQSITCYTSPIAEPMAPWQMKSAKSAPEWTSTNTHSFQQLSRQGITYQQHLGTYHQWTTLDTLYIPTACVRPSNTTLSTFNLFYLFLNVHRGFYLFTRESLEQQHSCWVHSNKGRRRTKATQMYYA